MSPSYQSLRFWTQTVDFLVLRALWASHVAELPTQEFAQKTRSLVHRQRALSEATFWDPGKTSRQKQNF